MVSVTTQPKTEQVPLQMVAVPAEAVQVETVQVQDQEAVPVQVPVDQEAVPVQVPVADHQVDQIIHLHKLGLLQTVTSANPDAMQEHPLIPEDTGMSLFTIPQITVL